MDISSMLEVQVREMKPDPDVEQDETVLEEKPMVQEPSTTDVTTTEPIPISAEEKKFYHLMFGNDMASVRYRRIHCTACDVHIGSAPSQSHNMIEHPVLRTLLCADCREFYGDGSFEQGDDATDMFCRWCANGGNLYCCSYCSNTFCYKCIKRNFPSVVRKKIEADEKWKCFVCNPGDLYCARATCWALLVHIQTVTRILKNEKNMTSEEIEDKMNLDESQCCPRRNKRRTKRKPETYSEDEDETYSPRSNGVPVHIRRKQLRQSVSLANKYNGIITKLYSYPAVKQQVAIRPNLTSLSCAESFQQAETQPLFSRERVMIESEVSPNHQPSDGIIVSPSSTISSSDATLASRYDSKVLQPTLYHTAIMNHAATSSIYVRPSTAKSATRQIVLPSEPTPSSSQTQSSYQLSQSLQPPPNTMVSIHNLTDNRSTPRVLLPKAGTSDMTLTPNIIELDSDSDEEPRVLEQCYVLTTGEPSNMNVGDISSKKVVPVALVSTENSDNDIKEEQPLREMCSSLEKQPTSFSEMMLPHGQELNKLLGNIKNRACDFFVLPENDNAIKDIESMAHQKIKQFYRNIRSTVLQLAHINDRVVREYNKWKRSCEMETIPLSTEQNTLTSQENVETPLDMICVNDSDTESEYDGPVCRIMESSNLVKDNNVVKDILFFGKNMVDRGVGDSALVFEDKAIQVCDVVLRDYEKHIGYSLLMKTDDLKTNDSVSQSTTVSEENFGKYEEQYIFYLQQMEGYSVDTEDGREMKELTNPNETLLEESMEVDSQCISELPQDIDLLEHTDKLKNSSQGESLENRDSSVINDASDATGSEVDKDKENTQVINDSNSDTGIQSMDMETNEKTHETGVQKTHNGVIVREVISINNDMSLSKNVTNVLDTQTAVTGSEEDCTIIED